MALTVEQKSSKLYKQYLHSSDTRTEREFFEEAYKSNLVVSPNQLWKYGDYIPCGDELSGGVEALNFIKTMQATEMDNTYSFQKSESESVPIVKRYIDFQLTAIDNGTDNAFILKNGDTTIQNIIPFNYCEDVYNYTLKTSTGNVIYFGVGDWALDCYSGILTFYGDVPDGVDHLNPPRLSFYQYIGGTGFRQETYGYEGAIIPIENFPLDSNTYCFSKDNTNNENTLLSTRIINAANIVEQNFVQTYGWDGSDENEGVALSLETIVPLYYYGTKDIVKGYEDAEDTELGIILTNKYASDYEALALNFVSPKCSYTSLDITLENNEVSIRDNLILVGTGTIGSNIGSIAKIKLVDGSFVVVERLTEATDNIKTYSITTSSTDTPIINGLVVYWSSSAKEYLPIRLQKTDTYSFGFPVVTVNGKIPPSIALRTLTLGSNLDSITPNYYGPRTTTVVVSSENYPNIESTDYVVKNKFGYYLSDILAKIHSDFQEGVIGTILFRPGVYTVDTDLDLSGFVGFKILAEAEGTVNFTSDVSKVISFTGSTSDFVTFENITFNNIALSITSESNIISFKGVSWLDGVSTIEISKANNRLSFLNCKTNNVNVSLLEGVVDNISDFYTSINNCTMDTVSINETNVIVSNSYVNRLLLKKEGLYVLSSIVNTLDNPDNLSIDYSQIRGSLIHNFSNVSTEESKYAIPNTGTFPIYENSSRIRYASFAQPFSHDEVEGKIRLLIDSEYFEILENGELSCHLNASQITVDNTQFKRQAVDENNEKLGSSVNTVQEALVELYDIKADLIDGKVPLQQLPDSVAYGGLLFVGTWSFEASNHAYPTFDDVKNNLGLSKDEVVDALQPGWFVVISPSTDEDNPAKEQEAIDSNGNSVSFTADDWCIYNGTSWEKLDKAYKDAAYMYLPVKCTNNKEWVWTKGGNGALDLGGKTITNAFEMTNDELRKLQPRKPYTINEIALQFTEDTPTFRYKELIQNGNVYTVGTEEHIAINSTNPVAITPKIDDFKNLVYISESADVIFTVDDTTISNIPITGDTETETIENLCKVSEAVDPYAEESFGAGYWKGVHLEIGSNSLENGSHTYTISVANADPDSIANGSQSLSFVTKTPFDLNATTTQLIASTDNSLETLKEIGSCSGIYKVQADFDNLVEIQVSNFTSGSLPAVGQFYELGYLKDPTATTDDSFVSFGSTNSIDITKDNNGYYLARINASFAEKVNSYEAYNSNYAIKLKNEVGDTLILKAGNLTFIKDPTTESERVYSGSSLNPAWNPLLPKDCGSLYNSKESLSFNAELMKRGRNLANGDFISEYSYPYGQYEDLDYTDCTGVDIEDKGTFRFATFASLENNELDEANGFVVSFDVADDNLDYWQVDSLTGSTDGLILQAKVLNEDGTSLTGWLDCNSPIGAFDTPTGDEEKAMYAGSSTAITKRISFGKATKTGTVIIRVGIAKGSNLAFKQVSIKEII